MIKIYLGETTSPKKSLKSELSTPHLIFQHPPRQRCRHKLLLFMKLRPTDQALEWRSYSAPWCRHKIPIHIIKEKGIFIFAFWEFLMLQICTDNSELEYHWKLINLFIKKPAHLVLVCRLGARAHPDPKVFTYWHWWGASSWWVNSSWMYFAYHVA